MSARSGRLVAQKDVSDGMFLAETRRCPHAHPLVRRARGLAAASVFRAAAEVPLSTSEQSACVRVWETHQACSMVERQLQLMVEKHDVGLVFTKDRMELSLRLDWEGPEAASLRTKEPPDPRGWALAAQHRNPPQFHRFEYSVDATPRLRLVFDANLGVAKVDVPVRLTEG
ncbi:hypothetical protein ACFQL8_09415 [Streptomyces goshikiensis]|uniref:hypothetical protein n=1 Tax=Streptomyces goshikiensis TaxID=1942 RepID=UPI00331F7F65